MALTTPRPTRPHPLFGFALRRSPSDDWRQFTDANTNGQTLEQALNRLPSDAFYLNQYQRIINEWPTRQEFLVAYGHIDQADREQQFIDRISSILEQS